MIIKHADSKQNDIVILQSLLNHPQANADTKTRIEREIRNIQAGIKGEQEAAYEMKVHYENSKNWMILHDLRIEHQGLFAQIDHLLINRWLDMWVCESKHFSEGVAINEQGEFVGFFRSKPYGVPSPIEQNNRHMLVLKRLFDSGAVPLPTRLGFTLKPSLSSLVLVSKGARIARPKAKLDGLEAVIKNDQLFKTIDKAVDDSGPLSSIAKIVSTDTLEGVARAVAKLHQPLVFNWHGKFGLTEQVAPRTTDSPKTSAPSSKLQCHGCGCTVPYNVAKFCWFNKPKFGGNVFCMNCQKTAVLTDAPSA